MTRLRLGYSSCPNDVFIFEALVSGRIDAPGLHFDPVIEDVEALNQRASRRELEITKISFHAFGHLRENYVLLDAGSALGRGCGPLLVAREHISRQELGLARVAIPGEWTTAALLLRLYAPEVQNLEVLVFDEIMPAVAAGEVDAGVIIHEGRFTFQERGLLAIEDLGDWWERDSGQPIPLGGIVAARGLGEDVIRHVDVALRRSIEFAHRHPAEIWDAIRRHAQELDDAVIRQHIDLYVNEHTESLGQEGREAIRVLFDRAERAGVLPPWSGETYFRLT